MVPTNQWENKTAKRSSPSRSEKIYMLEAPGKCYERYGHNLNEESLEEEAF